MDRTQRSAERLFPPTERRGEDAEAWLDELLQEWGVRSAPTRRWLLPARPALQQPDNLVLFAQYDSLLLLFTLEMWRAGQRVYGIDDWLG